ncbi:unnamed protein product [Mytilus coruscus]|uniref:Uncharacterized protein n=1 Tax=Mytilus coruscus TaxID=42192 RepID=A0A6J8EC83_MYTCO|nr:unnamed protein product [Mytilus coruscus]
MAATSTDTSLVCSFSAFTNTKCGLTPYFPKETKVLLLKYCQRNLKSHLSSYYIDDISTEYNLICHRVGIFAEIDSYSVCPYHRYSLGVYWKRLSKCTHPEHTGKGKPEGNRQGVTVAASLHLLQKFGCVIPVGSGLCVKCRKSLSWLQAGEQTSVSSLELQNAVLVKKMKKDIFLSDETLQNTKSGSLPLKKELSHRNRMDEVKLDHALSFFLNPDFQQICSYETKMLEFDNGEVVTIPQIVRTTCHSLLIDMYASYCNEEHFNPLSKSTQFKLLATCAAAKRSNLSGLDNIAADGAASMDNIIATLQKLQEHDISKDELEETTSDVKALKLYMKTMYKFDIKKTSHCKDHCINFALSNTKDILLQEACTDHSHDDVCNSCNLLGNVTEQIFKSVQKVSDEESRDDLYTTTTIDINNVKQWKAHQLRTKNQDEARLKLMESLEPHKLLLVMDWAMKFLPMHYREKQSDFFGQKGLNWHVSVAIVKPENTTLQHKTYVHLFDGVRQDWFAVASIIENTLMTIKKQMPNIEEVFLRSDNAGCYHCGCLWFSLYGISQRTGLKILRYDYSEAQSGKSFCDAKIAHMRSKMKMFVSSGNNISSAEEMQAAIMSGAGVTGCQCAVAEMDTSKQEMTSHRFKGVNSFSNLEFEDGDILVWNSYNIGIGKKIPRSSVLRQEQGETGLNVINDFSEPSATYGALKSKDT